MHVWQTRSDAVGQVEQTHLRILSAESGTMDVKFMDEFKKSNSERGDCLPQIENENYIKNELEVILVCSCCD